jgi:DNA polymerase alpha subunit A
VTQLAAEEVKDDIILENDAYTVHKYITSKDGVQSLVAHLEYNALLSLRLLVHLSLLPLSKELTNIAGNLWSKTLSGSRSDRVEYLLLHEFFNRKYIIPDKSHAANPFSNARRKAAYSGGLVLEPEKGLHDKYVLLLDFNSLYPSIILEHNICFTTIERPRKEVQIESKSSPAKNTKKNKKAPNRAQQTQDADERVAEGIDAQMQDTELAFEAQPPEKGLKQAILPSVIGSLLSKRTDAKREMAKAAKNGDKIKEWQYDIKQKSLKLTANSTYGCLGFQYSRFYCQPIAELITRLGRETLSETKNKIEQGDGIVKGYTVIYGDTDSTMVLTDTVNYDEAYKIGESIQSFINKGSRYMEIGIDGLFRRILLLRKKKYVAVVHFKKDGQIISKVENKGIDMVRRDWCELSREVSKFCVDQILKTSDTNNDNDTTTAEDVVNAIHQHLREVKEDVHSMQIPLNKFVITRGLTKAPEDYPDANHQPHVQVALEMKKRGIPVRIGQRIPYVICSKCSNPNPKTIADRAVHPQIFEEMNKRNPSNPPYVLDVEWYLSQQIYPPVFRLCEHIKETDGKMLADCLGLDKFKLSSTSTSNYDQINSHLNYTMISDLNDDDDKYKNVNIKALKCSHCDSECHFNLYERITDYVQKKVDDPSFDGDLTLISCTNCNTEFSTARLCNWIQKNIREQLKKYYSGWMVVPHHVIKAGLGQNRTRIASLTPKHGVVSGMVLSVREEFNAQDLQIHLQYYQQLFDWDKAVKKAEKFFSAKPEKQEYLKKLNVIKQLPGIDEMKQDLSLVKSKVHRFLQKSGRQWVQLDDLFSIISKISIN